MRPMLRGTSSSLAPLSRALVRLIIAMHSGRLPTPTGLQHRMGRSQQQPRSASVTATVICFVSVGGAVIVAVAYPHGGRGSDAGHCALRPHDPQRGTYAPARTHSRPGLQAGRVRDSSLFPLHLQARLGRMTMMRWFRRYRRRFNVAYLEGLLVRVLTASSPCAVLFALAASSSSVA
jgi:hypothetical protein